MTPPRKIILGLCLSASLYSCGERQSAPTAAAEPDNNVIAQAPAAPIDRPDTPDAPERNMLPDRTVAPSMTEPRLPPARPIAPAKPRPVVQPSPTQPPAEVDPVRPVPDDAVPL